jgi:hypothetical protein
VTVRASELPYTLGRRLHEWAVRSARDLCLNVLGFALAFGAAAALAVGIRTGVEKLLGLGQPRLALVFVLLAGGVWATLFGLVRKKDLRNPEGRILPLSAAGFLLGAAAMWIYIFAGVSYALKRLGFVDFTALRPDDLLYQLTDAYAWYFLDLLPGLNIPTALGWKSPVDLQGGVRGVLLVLFRVAVIYQIFAKGRELLKAEDVKK